MSPEIIAQQDFDTSADVYSFGIILWQLLTLQEPFVHHKGPLIHFDALYVS